ncbi:MAG: MBL fold metallo-hydrolase [Alphaproteobacteria bacterium]|nr:MBL fold metallo-hydrolase [Alphaproteobacteria bacterium]
MIIRQIPVTGMITTNAYFYVDEPTKHGFLIDPGAEADKLLKIIADNDWTIEKILLTHGHFDHIGAVNAVQKALNIPCIAHQNGKDYLLNPQYNLSAWFGPDITVEKFEPLADGDEITSPTTPNLHLKMIATAGHTQDAVIYYDAANHLAFVGDTIFKNSRGRTDIPGGDDVQLVQNIKAKILTLPDDTVLYSGHTEPTTVRAEKHLYDM